MAGIQTKWSEKDLNQLEELGISIEKMESQIESFKKGFPYVVLDRPCTPGDGIKILDDSTIENYISFFTEKAAEKSVVKFVPASGAASRMFKEVFNFIDKGSEEAEGSDIFDNLEKFAFSEDVKSKLTNDNSKQSIAKVIVGEEGLDYGNLPKGLIKFHKYDDEERTAFEEHLVEASEYAKGKNDIARVHFTVSPEHLNKVKGLINEVLPKYEKRYGVTYEISYSTQKKSTDTIAVDTHDEPFREEDGTILFRPGGHGALIENLGTIDADLVFIKNIDNVVPDRIKPETYKYKKALAGYLLHIQTKCFEFLKAIETQEFEEKKKDIVLFVNNELGLHVSEDSSKEELIQIMNRPIRVCGMVKNEGEPGGGPFWVNNEGKISHQIVESSQVDLSDAHQLSIMKQSTHFNPVDLVCGIKDYKGQRFDLMKYVDPNTGFISMKSKNGRDLKALELPGLWNGAMAKWITLFVEVPIITFNPVKTIRDLLRINHQ